MTIGNSAVPTVSAKVLLGWMEREQAISFICEQCVFPDTLTPGQADAIWRLRRDKVEALPERPAPAPKAMPLSLAEQDKAKVLMKALGQGGSIQRVIKIDPSELVTHQPVIIMDQANKYESPGATAADYARHSLAVRSTTPVQLQVNAAHNAADVIVPHGEYTFAFHPQAGFQIQELARHVSVTAYQGRMLLWAGYHRSYARMASANPEGNDRSLLVALTTDADFFVSPNSPNQGLRAMLCGLRPSLLRDFFDDNFFMMVNLKRKRWVLQIRASCTGVDDV
jgi:hypothetical protein